MKINEKKLEEHVIEYCKTCGISTDSKEAWHYEMGMKHALDESTRKFLLQNVSDCDNHHCQNGIVEVIYGEPLRCSVCDNK